MSAPASVSDEQIRIFSYLPSPRVAKATIAGRILGVRVGILGASPPEIPGWLFDFDARPLTEADTDSAPTTTGRVGFAGRALKKTEAFLDAIPYGTVPAAFDPATRTGVFESNSIMRAVARIATEQGNDHGLYGRGAFGASRVDAFLDASLVFARDSQRYLLAISGGSLDPALQASASESLETYLIGIERALSRPGSQWIAADEMTLADICFACEITLFHGELRRGKAGPRAEGLGPLLPGAREAHPRAFAHFDALLAHPAFARDLGPYVEKMRRPEGRM
ncbi:glutathione S-transferase [Hyaloraphidium curvatum]|nr:glutathione S-transferase [Hyaloraphidium curvatum]